MTPNKFICNICNVICTYAGITSVSFSLVFRVSVGNVEMYLKNNEKDKINTEKLFYLPVVI